MNLARVITAGAYLRSTAALRRPVQLVAATRSIHTTKTCHEKKQVNQNEGDEDAFVGEEEDLFASPSPSASESQVQTKIDLSTSAGRSGKITANRSERFRQYKEKLTNHPAFKAACSWEARQHNLSASLSSLISPHEKLHQIKLTHAPARAKLMLMITWASNRAELLEIADVFTIYRAKQWPIDELNRIDFIGRCINLKAPDIALAILYHRPKFGIDIPSLSTARALMQSLLVTPCPPPNADKTPLPEDMALPTSTPFTHALLLANLFDVYALPPVETDKVARALLLGACARELDREGDVENANTIIEKVREWAQNQNTQKDTNAAGVVLNNQDPKVKDGKLSATTRALKERGKVPPGAVLPGDTPLYSDELTTAEREWIERRLGAFVQWATKQGQDVSWVDRLKVTTT